jgi:hypothetical protein
MLQVKVQESESYERQRGFSDFMFAEINKDLLRLEKAASKQERYEILERLLYAPNINFHKIVNPNTGDLKLISNDNYERMPDSRKTKLTSIEKKLIEKREEMEKSGYFKAR